MYYNYVPDIIALFNEWEAENEPEYEPEYSDEEIEVRLSNLDDDIPF